MNENQLRNWLSENNLPDEWWYSVNGLVGESPAPLSDALVAGKGHSLHLCHTSRANENDWWKISTGQRPLAPPPVAIAATVDPVPSVSTGKRKQHVSQSAGGCLLFILGVAISAFTFPIGLIIGAPLMLGIFAQKRTYSCTECGNTLAKTSE